MRRHANSGCAEQCGWQSSRPRNSARTCSKRASTTAPPTYLPFSAATPNGEDNTANLFRPPAAKMSQIPKTRSPSITYCPPSGAKADVRVAGIYWGKGYDWKTVFFDVTPISFAKMGLMHQVHRAARNGAEQGEKI